MPSTVAADNESLTSYLRQRFIVSKADVKCSNDTLFCVSSPEKIRSFDPGPKIASRAFRSPALVASTSALPASAGEAKVLCASSVAARFWDLLHEARDIDNAKSASGVNRKFVKKAPRRERDRATAALGAQDLSPRREKV